MYCKKCGAENKENANFCCKCGSPLDFNNKKSKKLTDKQKNKKKKNKKKKNKGIYFAIFAVCLVAVGMVFLIQTQIRKQKEIKQAVQVCLDDLQQKNWSDLFQESDATKEEMEDWSEDVQKALTGEQKVGIIEIVNLIADHVQIDGKVSFGSKKVTYTVTIPDFTDFMKSIDLDRINTKEKLLSEVEEYLAETEPKTTKVELEYKKTDGSWMTNYMDKAFIHAVTGNLLIGYMESEQKTEIQNMLENNFESVYWDFLKENSADNAYFNLTDIDGDGIPELLTATEDHLYYNNQVNGKCAATGCTLYAFLGGSVKKLVYGESRYCYPILVENNQLMFPQRMKGLVVSLDHGTLVGYGEYYEKMTDVMYQVDLKELNLEEGFLEGSFCLDADPSQVGVPVEDLGYNFYFYEDDNGAILDFEENNEENRQKNFLIEMEETSDSSSQETGGYGLEKISS